MQPLVCNHQPAFHLHAIGCPFIVSTKTDQFGYAKKIALFLFVIIEKTEVNLRYILTKRNSCIPCANAGNDEAINDRDCENRYAIRVHLRVKLCHEPIKKVVS